MSGLASLNLFLADDPLCSGRLVARKGRGLGILDLDVAGTGLRDQLGHVDVINRQIRKVDVVLGARCCISRNGERHVVNVAILGDVRAGGVIGTSNREGVRVDRELKCAEVSAGGRTAEGRSRFNSHLGDVAVEALVAGDGNRYLHGLARLCILVLTDIPNCVYLLGLLHERSGRGGRNSRGGLYRILLASGEDDRSIDHLDVLAAEEGLLGVVADRQIRHLYRDLIALASSLCSLRCLDVLILDGKGEGHDGVAVCKDVVFLLLGLRCTEDGLVVVRNEAGELGSALLLGSDLREALLQRLAVCLDGDGIAEGTGIAVGVDGERNDRLISEGVEVLDHIFLHVPASALDNIVSRRSGSSGSSGGGRSGGLDRILLTVGEDDGSADHLDVGAAEEGLLCEVADGQIGHLQRDLIALTSGLRGLCGLDVLILDGEGEGHDGVAVREDVVFLLLRLRGTEDRLIVVRHEAGELGGALLLCSDLREALLQRLAVCLDGHRVTEGTGVAVGIDREGNGGLCCEGVEILYDIVLHVPASALDLLILAGGRRGGGRRLGRCGRCGRSSGLLSLAGSEDDGRALHHNVGTANEALLREVADRQVRHGQVDLVFLTGCLSLLRLLDVLILYGEGEGEDAVAVCPNVIFLLLRLRAAEEGLVVVRYKAGHLRGALLLGSDLREAVLERLAIGQYGYRITERTGITRVVDREGNGRLCSERVEILNDIILHVPGAVTCLSDIRDGTISDRQRRSRKRSHCHRRSQADCRQCRNKSLHCA